MLEQYKNDVFLYQFLQNKSEHKKLLIEDISISHSEISNVPNVYYYGALESITHIFIDGKKMESYPSDKPKLFNSLANDINRLNHNDRNFPIQDGATRTSGNKFTSPDGINNPSVFNKDSNEIKGRGIIYYAGGFVGDVREVWARTDHNVSGSIKLLSENTFFTINSEWKKITHNVTDPNDYHFCLFDFSGSDLSKIYLHSPKVFAKTTLLKTCFQGLKITIL